jgi:hypothetical protein
VLQRCFASLLAIAVALGFVSAAALAQPAGTATLAGTVHTQAGDPLPGVTVHLSGPATATTTTDATGGFSLSVPPGVYQIDFNKPGYVPSQTSSLPLVAGPNATLTVTLGQASLESLRTIGSTSTVTRGSGLTLNTSAAQQEFVSAQQFQNVGNPQINDVLQESPDVTIEHMGSQPDTTIIVGGVQPYETQVLIDGHPIALGQYGVFSSQYFPSWLLGGVEVQSGPGNTTPFANLAVGGTANLLTAGFTQRSMASLEQGIDEYGAEFTHLLASGSFNKLQYVIGAGVDGYNGPYFHTQQCDVTAANGGAGDNAPGNYGTTEFCGDASGSFYQKGELLKLKYNFSSATSFEAGFIGAWAGYNPQGTVWGLDLGPTTIYNCIGNEYSANPANGALYCSNPKNAGFFGQTINGISWYPGSNVWNNQTLFDAELRTQIGSNDTLLVRPYIGNLAPEIINGAGEADFPLLYSPIGGTTTYNYAPGATNTPAAIACNNSYGSSTGPGGVPVVTNGQMACWGSIYSTYEIDKLYGTTFSYLHPFGDSLLNLTYDFHGQSTFAYIDSPAGVSVPFSADRYSTISLTANLNMIRNIGVDVGLYDTRFTAIGVEPVSLVDSTLVGFARPITRFDPHLALTFRPTSDVSYRASWGTSTTYPFLGQLSGLATYEPPAQSLGVPYNVGGTLTEKNPGLEPEISTAYDIGVDKRLPGRSLLSLDVQESVVHNVFEQATTNVLYNGLCCEGIFSPINVARLQNELVTLKYTHAPVVGFGYSLSAAAERSVLDGIPASLYSVGVPSFPVNGVQVCGNGVAAPGIETCIPYLKGYADFNYRWPDKTYAHLGVDYEGKNNAYFQPPFELVDLSVNRPISKTVDIHLSVENLLNTNNYLTYLAMPGVGTPLVAGTLGANGQEEQTSFTPSAIPAMPRIVRLSVKLHTGG